MHRVVKSFNGEGQLHLASGDVLFGRYHIDVSFAPVRKVYESTGTFILPEPPGWDRVIDAQLAGPARIVMTDGTEIEVELGGILRDEISIVSADAMGARWWSRQVPASGSFVQPYRLVPNVRFEIAAEPL
ncbi:hypothetical protein SAMN05216548_102362 [Faunimonas pinastri]|uniref:Uncharacterized protein n=1 Tax=Faunimonas pinastri TaxID=1855383 RepID=A0A1H9D624_9HYPH|nr:hypothetical protein [Faunimonas pinastri]SEQ08910.1 hypothetical protein SAMN05216548_102362 [Faunimonas pinastri]